VDRWHYDIHRDTALSSGEHELKFTLLNTERQGVAQLCSAEMLEFGNEDEFVSTPGYYGIYPTYSDTNKTSYRPTSETCLMRVVTSPNFCKVCREGLWLALLRRVNLIDEVNDTCKSTDGHLIRSLHAKLVPLADLRQDAETSTTSESYRITWKKDGEVLHDFDGKTEIDLEDAAAIGNYTIEVSFSTDEVRVDKEGLLTKVRNYTISTHCPVDT